MHEEILARAAFLLTELRLPPGDAQVRLRDWFPELEHEERARYISLATTEGRADPGRSPRPSV